MSAEGAAGYKTDFWGKWVNAFMRVIPADRHIGAMGKRRRGRLPGGQGKLVQNQAQCGEVGRARTSTWFLGVATGNLLCSPGW